MENKETKKLIQQEILSLLDDNINNELNEMKDSCTVAEIAKEVLLSFDRDTYI